MDDLLNLMETNETEDDHSPTPDANESLHDLLELMEAPPSSSSATTTITTTPSGLSNGNSRRTASVTPTSPLLDMPVDSAKHISSVEGGVDEKLGIRMLNRVVSSIDLLDLISTTPYQSPATLSFMSLAQLTKILIDPPSIVDQATVNGKTNITTVGIVFSNTGTRISSKGNAFCILTIGTFNAGPCLSVMLFGNAYAQNCRSCTPGKVVALVMPTLMPKREFGGKTTMSFSVHDNRQFMMVATARDYGTCQATISTKRADGKWIAGGSCKNYVDKRVCQYCESHRKRQQKGKKQNSKGSEATTPKQRLREKLGQPEPVCNMPSNFNASLNNRFSGAEGVTGDAKSNPSQAPAKANIGLGRYAVPIHMAKGAQKNRAPVENSIKLSKQADCSLTNALRRRYESKQTQGAGRLKAKDFTTKSRGNIENEDWLKAETKKRAPLSTLASSRKQTNSQKKLRQVNTSGSNFDGSVFIPKPCTMFASRAPQLVARPTVRARVDNSAKSSADIKQKQAELANLLREQKEAPKPSSSGASMRSKIFSTKQHINFGRGGTLVTAKITMGKQSRSPSSFEGAFSSSVDRSNMDKVRNAKSRFADEADAEHYAKSRQALNELEKLESGQAISKTSTDNAKGMRKEWTCITCDFKKFLRKPAACKAAGHTVKFERVIIRDSTNAENRMKLQEKSVEDGGLRLGSGLEWTRKWDRFS